MMVESFQLKENASNLGPRSGSEAEADNSIIEITECGDGHGFDHDHAHARRCPRSDRDHRSDNIRTKREDSVREAGTWNGDSAL